MRMKCAFALWIWAFCIVCWAAKNLEPIFDWHGWMAEGWEAIKIALLAYSGFLLITAEQERERLEHFNQRLEQIVGELQSKH